MGYAELEEEEEEGKGCRAPAEHADVGERGEEEEEERGEGRGGAGRGRAIIVMFSTYRIRAARVVQQIPLLPSSPGLITCMPREVGGPALGPVPAARSFCLAVWPV